MSSGSLADGAVAVAAPAGSRAVAAA